MPVPTALSGNISTDDGATIPTLGFMVWWNLREVSVTRDWFKTKLDEVGLNGEKYAREHNYRATFIRCLKALEEQRLIRKVKEDGMRMIYQFTTESLVDDEDNPRLEYTPEMVVEIDKEAYWIDGIFADALVKCDEELKKVLVESFERERVTYRSSDITRYVQRIFRDEADIVSLRPQGSVYFVPASYQEVVTKVATVLAAIPTGHSVLEFFPVPDVKSARQSVGHGVEAEIADIFGKMESEITAMQNGGKEITDKWVTHRRNKIAGIKQRLAMYSDVLGQTAATLGGQFDVLASVLKSRVLEV